MLFAVSLSILIVLHSDFASIATAWLDVFRWTWCGMAHDTTTSKITTIIIITRTNTAITTIITTAITNSVIYFSIIIMYPDFCYHYYQFHHYFQCYY